MTHRTGTTVAARQRNHAAPQLGYASKVVIVRAPTSTEANDFGGGGVAADQDGASAEAAMWL
jgi:hypothetical protein